MASPLPAPDIAQAKRFLNTLDSSAINEDIIGDYTPLFTFQTFDDDKERKRLDLAKVITSDMDGCFDHLRALNKQRAGVYVTINETDGKGRKAPNITRVRAVWIDDDEGLEIPTPLEPHIITQTSPGKKHKIFLVGGLTFEQHRAVMEVLRDDYGSDPNAMDLSRVLRVPGFYHNKGIPFMSQLMYASEAAPYTAEQILAAFPPAARDLRTKLTPYKREVVKIAEPDYTPIGLNDPLPDINAFNAVKYLPIPGEQSYSEWRDVGMALHHQFEGSEEGLNIFDVWSSQARSYNGYADVAQKWDSFGKRTEGPIRTFKSLIDDYGKRTVVETKKKALSADEKGNKLIGSCSDYMELMAVVAPKLNRLAAGNVVLESDFTQSLVDAYAKLRPGSTLGKREVIKAMKTKPRAEKDTTEIAVDFSNSDTPEWAKEWVWVSGEERFFNVNTRASLSAKGFRGHFDSYIPFEKGSPRDSASYLRDNNLIPKVIRTYYAPPFGPLFTYEGVDCINTYNSTTRCLVPDTVEDEEAVGLFKKHVELTCGGWNRNAQLLCNWLASCTSDPPQKVRWATLLIGDFGVGKSLFYDLVALALGEGNTRKISNAAISASASSGQSGWAEGHCFGVIEELKFQGHNRYDALNALKEYVSNTVVPCRKLYKEMINIINTVNYLLLSNYLNAAPIEEGDRRYFIIQSGIRKADLANLPEGYFDRLFEAMHRSPGSIIRWLRDTPIHKDFKPNGTAPMTDTKETVIRLATDDLSEELREILIDDKAIEYGPEVVLFSALLDRIRGTQSFVDRGGKGNDTYTLKMALSTIGFIPKGRLSFKGERHSLWVKEASIDAEGASKILEDRTFSAVSTGDLIL